MSVEDINDNAPVFSKAIHSLTIPENDRTEKRYFLPQATDKDHPSNGIYDYRLTSSPNVFQLVVERTQPPTPYLTLTRGLDREAVSKFTLKLSCYDKGKPKRLSGEITLDITVEDVNDNNPVFDQPLYAVSVSEETPVGTVVASVQAHDADDGLNGKIKFVKFMVSIEFNLKSLAMFE